jgi:hypothetical protein
VLYDWVVKDRGNGIGGCVFHKGMSFVVVEMESENGVKMRKCRLKQHHQNEPSICWRAIKEMLSAVVKKSKRELFFLRSRRHHLMRLINKK